ncbi:MAG: acyltransferase family protein [Chitinophagaceae bacterium]|nr:acyltransferase family protein [Chitinophagaceae bacterium]
MATIAVISLHTASHIFFQYNEMPLQPWLFANAYNGLSRFCVPVFVMLSGALLLPKEHDIAGFLKKRGSRLMLPLLFWSLVYIAYTIAERYSEGQHMGLTETVKFICYQLRDGSAYHLWYVYMLMGIYLFVPIISKAIRHCTERQILYFLGIWLLVLISKLPYLKMLQSAIDFTYFTGYLGYFVLGYYLSLKTFKSRYILVYAATLFLAANLATFFGTWYLTRTSGAAVQSFYENMTPNILCSAIAIFVLFRHLGTVQQAFLLKIRNFIARYSYGIYLVHVLVLSLCYRFGLSGDFVHPAFGIPLLTGFCLLVSAGCVYLVHKLPFGRYISG